MFLFAVFFSARLPIVHWQAHLRRLDPVRHVALGVLLRLGVCLLVALCSAAAPCVFWHLQRVGERAGGRLEKALRLPENSPVAARVLVCLTRFETGDTILLRK